MVCNFWKLHREGVIEGKHVGAQGKNSLGIRALKQSMLGVFEAQKEDLWLRQSTRGKERENQSLVDHPEDFGFYCE